MRIILFYLSGPTQIIGWYLLGAIGSELVLNPAAAVNQWHFVNAVLNRDFRVVVGKKERV